MTDIPEHLNPPPVDPDHVDASDGGCVDLIDQAWALRLILASLRADWPARDAVLDEIGDCVGCLRRVVVTLMAEAAAAYLGPAQEDPSSPLGFSFTEEQREGAIGYIGELLMNVLDRQPPC